VPETRERSAINIFRALESAEGWFELDVSSVLQRMIDAAKDLLGDSAGNRVYLVDNPQPGLKARRVGRIYVEPLDDEEEYLVEPLDLIGQPDSHAADLIGKPDIQRRPDKEAGEWAIQSLIFDKEYFTSDQARQWITERDEYGDFGIDETANTFHFRQYDPKWFDMFRIITIAPGVSAVYSQVAEAENQGAIKTLSEEHAIHQAVKATNHTISTQGIQILAETCEVQKAEDGEGGKEERFVLGIVLEPTIGDDLEIKPDTQDDVYNRETIRAAAHRWMENYGLIDLMHSWEAMDRKNVRVLESYLAPSTFTLGVGEEAHKVLKGTWLLALMICNDDLWAAIKEGKIGAYSIGGVANREPVGTEA
jgi:hypothetical protein